MALVALPLSACGDGDDDGGTGAPDETAAPTSTAEQPASGTESTTPTPDDTSDTIGDTAEGVFPVTLPNGLQVDGLSTEGAAPLEFGATLAEAEELTGTVAEGACGTDTAATAGFITLDHGLYLWFDEGELSSWGISQPGMQTTAGLEVGISVEDARSLVPELTDVPEMSVLVLGSVPTRLSATYDAEGVITNLEASREANQFPGVGPC